MNQSFAAQPPAPAWAQAMYAGQTTTSSSFPTAQARPAQPGLPASKKILWALLGLVAGVPGVLIGALCYKGTERERKQALSFSLIGLAVSLALAGIAAALIMGGLHDLASNSGVAAAAATRAASKADTTYSYAASCIPARGVAA